MNPSRPERSPFTTTRPRRPPGDAAVAAPVVGRRAFAAMLAAGSLATLGLTRRAHAGRRMGDPDAVKEYLRAIVALVCGVAEYVRGEEGPLEDPVDRAFVARSIEEAAILGQMLLNESHSLLYSPPSSWLYWPPIALSDENLTETAEMGCEEAQQALEEYCASLPLGRSPEAAEHLFRLQSTYCHLFMTAGIG